MNLSGSSPKYLISTPDCIPQTMGVENHEAKKFGWYGYNVSPAPYNVLRSQAA